LVQEKKDNIERALILLNHPIKEEKPLLIVRIKKNQTFYFRPLSHCSSDFTGLDKFSLLSSDVTFLNYRVLEECNHF